MSDFVLANGLRLHYYRHKADQPTLLLLHGITDNGLCWTPVIEALGDDFDIIAPDARGHGLSDAPAHGYAAADHAADVAEFIRALGLNRPVVVGHSMGGMVATLVAAYHPDLVRAAIFEDPAWFDAAQQPPEFRRQRAAEWRADLLANHQLSQDALIAKGRANNPSWSDAELQPWSVAKQQVRPQVLEYIEHEAADWRAAVRALRVPALLITGDVSRGVIISPEQAKEAQALNALLSIAHVPDAGHSIRRDNFVGYMAAVRSFLAGLAR
ncbi:MAG: alpha/beta hydrolase [Anaerolineae bacterium]|nr:alpha/beta hydrolase [Candidatus Roseilinea sp.]MDW8451322.1 alpha/beta hydrolase [Anaerolineae bacterium]